MLVGLAAGAARAADSVYWTSALDHTLSFARLDGAGGVGLLNTAGATVSAPAGVAIDAAAGRIYWANADTNNDTISYARLDGSGGGQLNTAGATVDWPIGLAIDAAAGRIYWTNYVGGTISYARLDGSGGGQLNTAGATVSAPVGMAIDAAAGRIYWAGQSGPISYARLDGSGGGQLNTTGATTRDILGVAIDAAAGRIYWANDSHLTLPGTISYARLDGSGGGQLNTTGANVTAPGGIAIDAAAGRIYWANLGNDSIAYARLDGTGGGGQLNTTGATSRATFLALLRTPVGAGVPVVAGGTASGSSLSCSQGAWAPDDQGGFLSRAPQSYAYQWTRNGTDIPGATSSSYTASSASEYRCRVTAANHAGSAAQTSAAHTVVDDVKPTVTITTPAEAARYVVGERVAADFACADEGGSGLKDCVGTVADGAAIDTSSAGTKQFTVTARDNAGNTTTATHTYTVQRIATTLTARPAVLEISPLGVWLFEVSATLTDPEDAPISGQKITFSAGIKAICTATTNTAGTATCSGRLSALSTVLNNGYTATFAGTATYLPSGDTAPLIG